METGFSVWSRKAAAVLFMAVLAAAVLCMAGESAAESAKVSGMRVEAVRELEQMKQDSDRLKNRAAKIADNVAQERQKASSSLARELKVLEDELREVARTGDLSRMERKVDGNSNRTGDRSKRLPHDEDAGKKDLDKDRRPPNDNRKDDDREKRPPKDGDGKKELDKDRRPSDDDRDKDRRPPKDDRDRDGDDKDRRPPPLRDDEKKDKDGK